MIAVAVTVLALLAPVPQYGVQRTAINAIRAEQGLGPLPGAWRLRHAAVEWADHMASTGLLAHDPANAAACWAMGGHFYGENVGVGPTVTAVETAFETSPEHYSNIVDPHYHRLGVAVAHDGDGRVWVAQEFCG